MDHEPYLAWLEGELADARVRLAGLEALVQRQGELLVALAEERQPKETPVRGQAGPRMPVEGTTGVGRPLPRYLLRWAPGVSVASLEALRAHKLRI